MGQKWPILGVKNDPFWGSRDPYFCYMEPRAKNIEKNAIFPDFFPVFGRARFFEFFEKSGGSGKMALGGQKIGSKNPFFGEFWLKMVKKVDFFVKIVFSLWNSIGFHKDFDPFFTPPRVGPHTPPFFAWLLPGGVPELMGGSGSWPEGSKIDFLGARERIYAPVSVWAPVCTYVCAYMRACACMHRHRRACAHVCVCAHICAYGRTYACICACACMYACVHAYVRVCTRARAYARTRIRVCADARTPPFGRSGPW